MSFHSLLRHSSRNFPRRTTASHCIPLCLTYHSHAKYSQYTPKTASTAFIKAYKLPTQTDMKTLSASLAELAQHKAPTQKDFQNLITLILANHKPEFIYSKYFCDLLIRCFVNMKKYRTAEALLYRFYDVHGADEEDHTEYLNGLEELVETLPKTKFQPDARLAEEMLRKWPTKGVPRLYRTLENQLGAELTNNEWCNYFLLRSYIELERRGDAEQLFERFFEKEAPHNLYALKTMLEMYAKDKSDIQKMLKVWSQLSASWGRSKMSDFQKQNAVKSILEMLFENEQYEQMHQVFISTFEVPEEMRTDASEPAPRVFHVKLSERIATLMIRAYAKLGVERYLNGLQHVMQQNDVAPNDFAISMFIYGYSRVNASIALQLFCEYYNSPISDADSFKHASSPFVYSMLIQGFAREDDLEQVRQLFTAFLREMQLRTKDEAFMKKRRDVFVAYMAALIKFGDLKDAYRVFRTYFKNNDKQHEANQAEKEVLMSPNSRIYYMFVKAFKEVGELQLAERLEKELKQRLQIMEKYREKQQQFVSEPLQYTPQYS